TGPDAVEPGPDAVEPGAPEPEPAVPEHASPAGVHWRRRVAAYGVARDRSGRVLLVPGREPEHWTLPGCTVAHGESRQAAVARWTVAQTGLTPRVRPARTASADQERRPDGVLVHHDRLVF